MTVVDGCRVKCRVGVRVIGVENRNSSRWRVTFDLNAKRQTATVAAYSLQYNNSVALSATSVAEESVYIHVTSLAHSPMHVVVTN